MPVKFYIFSKFLVKKNPNRALKLSYSDVFLKRSLILKHNCSWKTKFSADDTVPLSHIIFLKVRTNTLFHAQTLNSLIKEFEFHSDQLIN